MFLTSLSCRIISFSLLNMLFDKNGLGKYVTNEGNSYEGYWKENMKHGKDPQLKKKKMKLILEKDYLNMVNLLKEKWKLIMDTFQHNIT